MKTNVGVPWLKAFHSKHGGSLSPDDMRVPSGGPSVAPNDNAGRPDPGLKRVKRSLFNQRYYQSSLPHADYLHGNPDARREIGEG